jgi:hypothetical protein
MKTSENIDAISAALAKAQGEIQNPVKNRENPHFRSSYADLAGGLDTIRPALSKHGISFVQMTSIDGDMIVLHTRLMHAGQWLEGLYPVGKVSKPQEMMSALTYAKRAGLFAAAGVAGEDDDDDGGNSAGTIEPSRRKHDSAGAKAQAAAHAEAETYVERAIIAMGEADSVDFLKAWWKSESSNRQLHFQANNDPLFVKLKDEFAKRGAELIALDKPTREAAE